MVSIENANKKWCDGLGQICKHDEPKTCVDCQRLCCPTVGRDCDECGAFWCNDWRSLFIKEGKSSYASIICPQCYFANSDWYYSRKKDDYLYTYWNPHCDSLAVRGSQFLKDAVVHTRLILVGYPRFRDEGKPITALWHIDKQIAICNDNGVKTEFKGQDAIEQAMAYAQTRIAELQKEGWILFR